MKSVLAWVSASIIAGCGARTVPLFALTDQDDADSGLHGGAGGAAQPPPPLSDAALASDVTTGGNGRDAEWPGDASKPVADARISNDAPFDATVARDCVPLGSYRPPPGYPADGSRFRLSNGVSMGVKPTVEYVAIDDVTGDGRNDIVVRDAFTGGWVYAQTPSGSRREIGPLDVGLDRFNWSGPVLFDTDGDRISDLIIGNAKGLFIVRALGNGSFADAVPIQGAVNGDFRLYDENHDGRVDLVGVQNDYMHSQFSIVVYHGNNTGSFDSPVISMPSDSPTLHSFGHPSIADVTGDGIADLVGAAGANIAIYAGQPQGGFASQAIRYPLLANALVLGLDVGDIDGDGKADVVVSEDSTDMGTRLVILRQSGALFRDPTTLLSFPVAYAAGGAVKIVDINLDGRNDIVHVGDEFKVHVFLGTSSGLAPEQFYAFPTASSVLEQAMGVADVDCDGCPDVVASQVGGLVLFQGVGCRMSGP